MLVPRSPRLVPSCLIGQGGHDPAGDAAYDIGMLQCIQCVDLIESDAYFVFIEVLEWHVFDDDLLPCVAIHEEVCFAINSANDDGAGRRERQCFSVHVVCTSGASSSGSTCRGTIQIEPNTSARPRTYPRPRNFASSSKQLRTARLRGMVVRRRSWLIVAFVAQWHSSA